MLGKTTAKTAISNAHDYREIGEFRDAHDARYGHDLDRICAALRERQAESSRRVVNRGPRLLRQEIEVQK